METSGSFSRGLWRNQPATKSSGCSSQWRQCRASEVAQDLQEKKRMWVTSDSCRTRFIPEVFSALGKCVTLHLSGTDTKRGCPGYTPSSMVHRGGNSAGFQLFFFLSFSFFLRICKIQSFLYCLWHSIWCIKQISQSTGTSSGMKV